MKKNLNSRKLLPVYISILSVLFVAASCNSPKKEGEVTFDLAQAKKEIIVQNTVFMNALRKKDSVGVAKCYTLNSKFMLPNGKSVVGRENLIPVFRGFIMGGMTNITIKPVEVWGNEDMMTVEQEWKFTDKKGKIIDSGKSLELWKKEDGEWKIFRDCFNSDLPMPKV